MSVSRKHFSSRDDISLLVQVNLHEPWAQAKMMDAWGRVAGALGADDSFNGERGARSCRSRFMLLVKHYREGNRTALRRTSTDDEFDEKMQLLDGIVDKMDAHAETVTAQRERENVPKRRLDVAGQAMVDAAVGQLQELAPSSSSDSYSGRVAKKKKKKDPPIAIAGEKSEIDSQKLELWRRQLDLQAKQVEVQTQTMEMMKDQFMMLVDLVQTQLKQ